MLEHNRLLGLLDFLPIENVFSLQDLYQRGNLPEGGNARSIIPYSQGSGLSSIPWNTVATHEASKSRRAFGIESRDLKPTPAAAFYRIEKLHAEKA